jgi:membrane fusion protein (multidrug efflux system)
MPDVRTDAAQPRASRRTRTLFVLAAAATAAAVTWGGWWTVYGRFQENTEDAYIKADSMTVSPKVGGYVEAVYVQDNQWVKKGTPLVRLDNRQYQAAQDKADATIAASKADVDRAQADIEAQQAQLAAARVNAAHAADEWKRYAPLAVSGAATDEKLAELKNSRDQTAADVLAAQGRLASSQAQIIASRAQLKVAQADMRRSKLDLGDTVLYSAMDGKIGDRGVRVGQLVQPGTRLMTVVPMDRLYIVANFKETQIGRMRIGQPVRIRVDALSDSIIHGRVDSFSPGTGSEFALLPPENATGNFTKIVQRVPVRIRLEGVGRDTPLMPGLSVTVEVDTRGTQS